MSTVTIPACARRHQLGWHVDDLSAFELRLLIRLPPFSFKRAKQIIHVGEHASLGLTKEAKAWMREAAAQLRAQWTAVFRSSIPRDVELNAAIRSYLPTRRVTDASNLYEGPQDALKRCGHYCKPRCERHAGVIDDDAQIRTHDGSDRLHDPTNPRVEIVLTPYAGCSAGQPLLTGLARAPEPAASLAEIDF